LFLFTYILSQMLAKSPSEGKYVTLNTQLNRCYRSPYDGFSN